MKQILLYPILAVQKLQVSHTSVRKTLPAGLNLHTEFRETLPTALNLHTEFREIRPTSSKFKTGTHTDTHRQRVISEGLHSFL